MKYTIIGALIGMAVGVLLSAVLVANAQLGTTMASMVGLALGAMFTLAGMTFGVLIDERKL